MDTSDAMCASIQSQRTVVVSAQRATYAYAAGHASTELVCDDQCDVMMDVHVPCMVYTWYIYMYNE